MLPKERAAGAFGWARPSCAEREGHGIIMPLIRATRAPTSQRRGFTPVVSIFYPMPLSPSATQGDRKGQAYNESFRPSASAPCLQIRGVFYPSPVVFLLLTHVSDVKVN